MAINANLIFSGALLLVLISSYGIISTEERLLKSTQRNKKSVDHDSIVTDTGKDSQNNINSRRNILERAEYHEPTSVGKSTSVSAQKLFRPPTRQSPAVARVSAKRDYFRPTTPGHSLSVGNIFEHAEYYEPTPVGKSPRDANVSGEEVFRSLIPGHSPGVSRVSADTDDFRPTTPGPSPGVGNKKHAEYYKPNPVGKSHSVADVSGDKVFRPLIPGNSPGIPRVVADTDDFRPTTPGPSPGVGNKKHAEYYKPNPVGKSHSAADISGDKMFRPLIPGNSPGIPRVSEDTDDFRPTTPGHSPGAGHRAGPTSEGQN